MERNPIDIKSFTRKLGKDTVAYMPAKLLPGILTLASVAIFTRIFDPTAYGEYMIVITTALILTAVLSQWITQSTLRYRAQYLLSSKATVFNKHFITILLLLSAILCLTTLIVYPFRMSLGSYHKFLIITGLIVISEMWFDNTVVIFQADLRAASFSIYTIINAVLKLALSLAFILVIGKNISALLWGIVVAYLLTTIPMIATQQGYKWNHQIQRCVTPNLAESFQSFLKKFIKYGFPMIGWYLGAQLLSISDRYLLQIFRSSEEVGIYSSNYNLVASAISFVSMPLLTAAHPLLMNAGAQIMSNKDEIQKLITTFSRYYLIIALPVIAFVVILSKDLAAIFLGAAYRQGNLVLPIVLCGLFAWYFAMFGHKGLEFRERTTTMFLYVMICTGVKISLNILFIPNYGYMAAAIATMLCFFIYPVLVFFGTKSDIKWIIPWRSFARVSISSAILAIVFVLIHTLHLSSAVSIIISAIVMIPIYTVVLYVVNEIKPDEKNVIKKILRGKLGNQT